MTSEHFKPADLEARVTELEEALGLHREDSTLRNLPFGTLKQAGSMLSLRSVGGTYGGAYPAGVLNMDIATTSQAFPANYLYAIPFYMPGVPNVITKMGIRVVTAIGGSAAHLAIYEDKKERRLYPGKKILSGNVSTATTGTKSITIREGLPRGLVWVVLLGSAGVTLSAFAANKGIWALLGFNEGGSARYTQIKKAYTYGALPNPFPLEAVEVEGVIPYVFLKFG